MDHAGKSLTSILRGETAPMAPGYEEAVIFAMGQEGADEAEKQRIIVEARQRAEELWRRSNEIKERLREDDLARRRLEEETNRLTQAKLYAEKTARENAEEEAKRLRAANVVEEPTKKPNVEALRKNEAESGHENERQLLSEDGEQRVLEDRMKLEALKEARRRRDEEIDAQVMRSRKEEEETRKRKLEETRKRAEEDAKETKRKKEGAAQAAGPEQQPQGCEKKTDQAEQQPRGESSRDSELPTDNVRSEVADEDEDEIMWRKKEEAIRRQAKDQEIKRKFKEEKEDAERRFREEAKKRVEAEEERARRKKEEEAKRRRKEEQRTAESRHVATVVKSAPSQRKDVETPEQLARRTRAALENMEKELEQKKRLCSTRKSLAERRKSEAKAVAKEVRNSSGKELDARKDQKQEQFQIALRAFREAKADYEAAGQKFEQLQRKLAQLEGESGKTHRSA